MTEMLSNCDTVRRSLEGPDWRWRYALELAEGHVMEEDDVDDVVQRAAGFVRMMNSAYDPPPQARRRFPIIAQAKALSNSNDTWQQFVIMVLGNFTRKDMSAKLSLTPDVIETAEQLFFDVRDSRDATAWINIHVILPEKKAGRLEQMIKYRKAYWGGQAVAARILETGKRISADSEEPLIELREQLQIKCLAALEMPLANSQDAIRFLKIGLDLQYRSARLEFEKERFRTQAEQELRKHKLAEHRRRDAVRRFEREHQAARQKLERRQQAMSDLQRHASIQESVEMQRRYKEQQKRIERAHRTPLASLFWARTTKTSTIAPEVNMSLADEQLVAA